VNIVAPGPVAVEAWPRVLGIQTKLHRWAVDDGDRRFDDLFGLVTDPSFLRAAWERVRTNRGARTAGVDGVTARYITTERGEDMFLAELRADLRSGRFVPLAVRERMIPKSGGRLRRLGIPTVRDRVVQAALKLVLEPIFEADFYPCSYGFRPKRRTLDAIAEIQYLGTRSYEWVLEADIEACFDMIDHTALMDRVRHRVGDKRVLRLIKAFLKSGLMTSDGQALGSITGTPQGGILSPLLANIALSVLDEKFAQDWEAMGTVAQHHARRRRGQGTWRLVRYADDFVVMVSGSRANAEQLRTEVTATLAPIGLRLSDAKTQVVHLDEGLDFLGFRIQRKRKRGHSKRYVYTYPSRKAVMAIKAKVRALTNLSAFPTLSALLSRLNSTLRGWAAYFQHGVSKRTFSAIGAFAWRRVIRWLRKRHHRASWASILRRYLPGWVPTDDGISLFNPVTVPVTRYRYRGNRIPNPWTITLRPARAA
jgi:RNA-directed DNA polymerase